MANAFKCDRFGEGTKLSVGSDEILLVLSKDEAQTFVDMYHYFISGDMLSRRLYLNKIQGSLRDVGISPGMPEAVKEEFQGGSHIRFLSDDEMREKQKGGAW